MAIFEKAGYWGLKDPLEVRVQHETCIYMRDTFSSHLEPKNSTGLAGGAKNSQNWPIFVIMKDFAKDERLSQLDVKSKCV